MTTPDEMAAREIADYPVVADLGEDHMGAIVQVGDSVGELRFVQQLSDGLYFLSLRTLFGPDPQALQVPADTEIRLVRSAPPPEFGAVDTALLRELASVSDQIKAKEGEVEGLKEHRRRLQEKVLDEFALNGVNKLTVDGRPIYTREERHARLLERPIEEGGGRYEYRDFVPVLRQLGFEGSITPENVHHKTLTAVLRELLEQAAEAAENDTDEPPALPPELAHMVELVSEIKVVVGAPRRTKKA